MKVYVMILLCFEAAVIILMLCCQALPVLVEQLHQTPAMEPSLLLSLLRCVYCCLLLLERSSQVPDTPRVSSQYHSILH